MTARSLVVALSLVITSPLWHGVCHHSLLDSTFGNLGAPHRLLPSDGSTFSTQALDGCPTCLSQRLLSQVQVEQARWVLALQRTFSDEPALTGAVTIFLVAFSQSRAPPLC